MKKSLRVLLSLVLVLSMCLPLMAPVFAAEDAPWDADYKHSMNIMPFAPSDGYVSMQNPPRFTWGLVTGINNYELVVARDSELKDVIYKDDTLVFNYTIPSQTFDTGVSLYWAVRYKTGKEYSTWSQIRKFRIDPEAIENVLPKFEDVMKKVPTSHPRVWLQPHELETFRTYKDTSEHSKKVYDYVMKYATQYADSGEIMTEEEAEKQWAESQAAAGHANLQTARSIALTNMSKAQLCAYAYLMSGDERLGRFAADILLEYTKWDYKSGMTSYHYQDQTHREIAYRGAMCYDWIYPLLTPSEREKILEHIRQRTLIMEYLLNSLDKSPYDSHGWTAYGFIGIIAVATYGEIPEAAGWLDKVIKGYSSLLPPWTYEDGGWAQGTGYARYSKQTNHEFMCVLAAAGILNLYNNTFHNQDYLWSIYTEPYWGIGSFGDEGYFRSGRTASYVAFDMMHEINFIDNPETNGIRKWLIEKNGGMLATSLPSYWLAPKVEKTEAIAPKTLQLAKEYHDVGWVNMTNDLNDPEAILLTFKSSPWGSFNHSHADQNSFFIQAYGEPLAVTSGYYDSYHSTHDSGFTRKSGAHNTVTVATNKGQKDDDMSADGHLTGFLTQIDFDLVKGDATEAYKGGLGKFERAIVYIRPDMFVVVDDLVKADNKKSSKFEWWLNAENNIKPYEEGNGARIHEKDAVLDAIVQYPEKVTTYYTDKHELSDMVEVPVVTRFTNSNVQKRVWFETEKVEATKMIVTLDVHRENQEAKFVDTEYFDNYVKMTFEDGTIMLVNLGESTDEVVTKDGITFTGQIVVFNDESIMLVGGTSLKQGDNELITLEKEASVVMGQDEVSLSTYEDNKICINITNNYVDSFERVTDYSGREISSAIGITYEKGKLIKEEAEKEGEEPVYTVEEAEDFVTFTCEKDNYELMLNGKLITTENVTTNVKVTIDGEEKNVEMSGYRRRDNKVVYSANMPFDGNKYKVVDKSKDLIAGAMEIGSVGALQELNMSTENPEGQFLTMEKIPVVMAKVVTEADYDKVKENLAVFVEAEDYEGLPAPGAAVYNTRTFLSGGKGVQLFNNPATQMYYEFDVKEEGDYNFAVKYVAWEDGGAQRAFNLGGKDYNFIMEMTADYGTSPDVWRVAVMDEPIHLTPGKHTLTLDVISGMWNYDWLGLIKK